VIDSFQLSRNNQTGKAPGSSYTRIGLGGLREISLETSAKLEEEKGFHQ
jgi:hypothetical protein